MDHTSLSAPSRTPVNLQEIQYNSRFVKDSDQPAIQHGRSANLFHHNYMFKKSLLSSDQQSSSSLHAISSSDFTLAEANFEPPISQRIYTPHMTNEIDIMNKKNYRKESIIRWKRKRSKVRNHHPSTTVNTLFPATNYVDQAGPSNQPSCVSNETTDRHFEKQEGRKRTPKTRRKGHIPTIGRDLLQYVPLMADTLPKESKQITILARGTMGYTHSECKDSM